MDDYAATFGMFHEDCSQGSSFASGSWRVGSGSIPYATFSILTAASDIVISLAVICTLCLARNVELPAELCWQSAFLCMITLGLLALHSRVYAMEILHDSSSQIRILSVWLGCIGGLCVPLILWVSRTPEAMAFFRWEILLLLGLATVLGFAHYGYRNLAVLGLRRQAITQSVAIIGASEDTSRAIRLIRERCIGVTVRAIYDDQPISLDHAFEGVRVAGSLVDLLNDHQHDPLEWAVIVTNGNERERIATLKDRLIAQPLRVKMLNLQSPRSGIDAHGRRALPGLALETVLDLPMDARGRVIKSVFDRIGAGIALMILAPVLLFCVAGIKFSSPGPVLFRQRRIGYRNRAFHVYKFRSMHIEACNLLRLTARDDPRVFPFGQLMRRLSLDELPQFFNVLRGEMSMVGPRPHMPEARAGDRLYYEVIPHYASRHRVKPGITGWAQVNGWRGPTDTVEAIEQRVAHDMHYIDHWSFILDLKILLKTALGGFFGRNAF